MTKNKGGRPSRYPYELLFATLMEYASKNPMGKITYSTLAKETDIPRHIWRDNKEIQADIERVNNEPLSVDKKSNDATELPNIAQIIENNYSNKKVLIEKARDYMDYLDHLSDTVTKIEIEKQKMENEIEQLKKENALLKEANDIYKNQLKEVAIKSTTSKGRNELGINKNILSVQENVKKAGATIRDINHEFQELFD